MTECARCGACCERINVPVSKRALRDEGRERHPKGSDGRHILDHFRLVGRIGKLYYWRCDLHDTGTNECMAHDERPRMCSGFPWYGGPPDPKAIGDDAPAYGYEKCSFWRDIPKKDWPANVTPLPSPRVRRVVTVSSSP